MRLNKFLAEQLGLSRRQADNAIAAGEVLVNGETVKLGARVDENSKICYNGKIVARNKPRRYLKFYKPVGYVCSRKAQGENPTIYDLLEAPDQELKTVGRLDKDSEGLIILTNDGDFGFKMTHPSFKKLKIYVVKLDQPLQPLHQQMIADFGINLKDGRSKLGLTRLDDQRKNWEVVMSEGRNRQIRRTFGALGYAVVNLKRIQFGNYQLLEMKPGEIQEIEVN